MTGPFVWPWELRGLRATSRREFDAEPSRQLPLGRIRVACGSLAEEIDSSTSNSTRTSPPTTAAQTTRTSSAKFRRNQSR